MSESRHPQEAATAGSATSGRTFIDVLQHGNRELFHSAMVAWFLDPGAEHSLGDRFLRSFAERIRPVGSAARAALLAAVAPTVRTEVHAHRGRYDIEVSCGDSRVVIENKTKSVGDPTQLDRYKGEQTHVIALGLCEASYDQNVRGDYPVMTYQSVLDVLDDLHPAGSEWAVLANHYRAFLRRELCLLAAVRACYEQGDLSRDAEIAAALADERLYSENDVRFLHLVMLQYFSEYLATRPVWRGTEWSLDKNMRSGVWLANFRHLPGGFTFSQPIQQAIGDTGAGLWFHVELWRGLGLRARSWDDVAGCLQLRCYAKGRDPASVRERFQQAYEIGQSEAWTARTKKSSETYFLVRRELKKSEFVFGSLEAALRSFMAGFGSFAGLA
ncbi:MAG TPA: PD-(D/E)XK nuclease family protein [Phycisphaerae bacterium]|nr:PD-(D/E)XK nuclease family protein [Phycisphaerae bacterium]